MLLWEGRDVKAIQETTQELCDTASANNPLSMRLSGAFFLPVLERRLADPELALLQCDDDLLLRKFAPLQS
jgi:hypothetical protein